MNRLQPLANFFIVLVLGAVTLKEGAFILVPLVWGIFFAFSLHPVSSWLERRKFPRALAISLSILLVSVIGLSVLYLLFSQMIGLIKDVPEIGDNLENKLSRYLEELRAFVGNDLLDPASGSDIYSLIPAASLNETLFTTGKSIILIGIIPLYTFLLMYYKDFFVEFLIRLSSKNQHHVINWAQDSGQIIQSYLAGMLRVTAIVALLAGIFFYLIGIKYFVLFAMFIAIMNLIPYVGVFFSSVFAILYVFLTTDSPIYPIATFGVLWGIQLLENNIITPLVVGSKVKVNALAVIIAILLGGWLWGISGMVLFIPITGVLKITLERSDDLKPFAYLLGDEVPVSEESENFWKLALRKYIKKGRED
jgi:predicted PurR-regulated permease PerM